MEQPWHTDRDAVAFTAALETAFASQAALGRPERTDELVVCCCSRSGLATVLVFP